jgi:NTE family protein
VADQRTHQDTLAFQVDLWSARGEMPGDLAEVATRQKEIQYSSRTRDQTSKFKHIQTIRAALARLLEQLPAELRAGEDATLLGKIADHSVHNLVHLIYHSRNYEGQSKDYEFSRLSMEDHWRAGYNDAVRTLRHPEILQRPANRQNFQTFDLARDGRE